MLRFKTFLQEDVEPQILRRSIWVVGRPGSGKSMFANLIKKTFPSLQLIDSDKQFEMLLKQAGIDKDLRNMDPDKQKKVGDIRDKAIDISRKRWDTLTGMTPTEAGDYNKDLGFIYVGTGASIGWMAKKITEFELWGYKPFIIYVNTPVEVAKDRNLSRDRKVDDKFIDNFDTEDKSKNFKNLVGNRNFIELINDTKLNDEQAINKKFPSLLPRLKQFVSSKYRK